MHTIFSHLINENDLLFGLKTIICTIYIIVENISSNIRIEILCSLVAKYCSKQGTHVHVFLGVFIYMANVIRFVCDIIDDIGTFICLECHKSRKLFRL